MRLTPFGLVAALAVGITVVLPIAEAQQSRQVLTSSSRRRLRSKSLIRPEAGPAFEASRSSF